MNLAKGLYFKYMSIHLKSMIQHKKSFVLMLIGEFLGTLTGFIGINFIFQRFHNINGFTYNQILLCYSIFFISYSVAEGFTKGFDKFSEVVKLGGFDRFLLRPRNLLLQTLYRDLDLSKLGQTIQAIFVLVIAVNNVSIVWTFSKVLGLIFMMLGGMILFFSLFMLCSVVCFFSTENIEIMNIFTSGSKELCKYPIVIYGKVTLKFCTFIIPYALVQYYPLLYILGINKNIGFIFFPFSSILFLFLCIFFWKLGVRNYKSSGS